MKLPLSALALIDPFQPGTKFTFFSKKKYSSVVWCSGRSILLLLIVLSYFSVFLSLTLSSLVFSVLVSPNLAEPNTISPCFPVIS